MPNHSLAPRQNPVARLQSWDYAVLLLCLLLPLAAWQWGYLAWRFAFARLGIAPDFGLSSFTWGELGPLLAMVNPVIAMAAAVAAQKDDLVTRTAAYAAMLGTAAALLLTLWPEAARLAEYRGSLPPGVIVSMAGGAYKLVIALSLLAIAMAWCLLSPEAKAEPVPVKRAASQNFGTADWLSMAEAQQRFPGPHPLYGGIVIGEAYRVDQDRRVRRSDGTLKPFDPQNEATWGRGGRMPLLIDPCRSGPTHGLVVAGSGAFKTSGIVVPTLLSWTGSVVVLDPSGEIAPMVTEAREAMGHRVLTLDPAHPEAGSINILDIINPAAPLAESAVENIVMWLCGEPATEQGASASGAVFQVASVNEVDFRGGIGAAIGQAACGGRVMVSSISVGVRPAMPSTCM